MSDFLGFLLTIPIEPLIWCLLSLAPIKNSAVREWKGGKRSYFKDTKECVTFFCSSGLAALQVFHFAKAQFSELFICIFKERA